MRIKNAHPNSVPNGFLRRKICTLKNGIEIIEITYDKVVFLKP